MSAAKKKKKSGGDVFSRIAAFVLVDAAMRGTTAAACLHLPRHQRSVMPIDETSRRFVPPLRNLGYDVTSRLRGGHAAPNPSFRRPGWFTK